MTENLKGYAKQVSLAIAIKLFLYAKYEQLKIKMLKVPLKTVAKKHETLNCKSNKM